MVIMNEMVMLTDCGQCYFRFFVSSPVRLNSPAGKLATRVMKQ